MAVCPYCSTQISPGLVQCPSCAAPLVPVQNPQQYPQSPVMPYSQQMQAAEPVVSVSAWMGWIVLCTCFPILGSIITMFTAKQKSVQNFAKAMLIFMCVAAVLGIIAVFSLGFLAYML